MSSESSEARTIWTHGRTYLVGNFLSRLSGLLLIPVYAKFLSPAEFGVYSLILVAMDFLAAALGVGISSALPKVFVDNEGEAARNRVLSSTLLAFSAIGATVLLLSWPLALGTSRILFGSTDQAGVLVLALCAWVFIILFEIELDCYRVRKRSVAFMVLSLVKAVWLLVISVVFVVVLDYGVKGIFLGLLLTFMPLSVVLLAVLLRETGAGFSLPVARAVLGLGVPLVPAGLFDAAGRVAERYFLNRFLSSAAVAHYSLGATLVQFINVLAIQPFAQIYILRRFETERDSSAQTQLSEILLYFVLLLITMGLGLSLLAPEAVLLIATPAYLPTAQVIPFLAMAICVQAISYVHFEVNIIGAKRTGVLAMVSGVCLALGMALSLFLILRVGLVGAAIAALGTQILRLGLIAAMSRRLTANGLKLPTARIVGAFLLASAFYVATVATVGYDVDLTRTPMRIVLLACFVAAAFFSPIVGTTGRALAIRFVKHLWARRASARLRH